MKPYMIGNISYTYSTYKKEWVSCDINELPVLGIGGKMPEPFNTLTSTSLGLKEFTIQRTRKNKFTS